MSIQHWISAALERDLKTLARELDGYADGSQIWSTPHGLKNSAGTLSIHLIGNTDITIAGRFLNTMCDCRHLAARMDQIMHNALDPAPGWVFQAEGISGGSCQ